MTDSQLGWHLALVDFGNLITKIYQDPEKNGLRSRKSTTKVQERLNTLLNSERQRSPEFTRAASPAGEFPNLRLRTDNGPQYGGREFKKAMQVLGIRHEFIWKHTPEQNGHVGSFHGTLKKEYMWPHDFARFQDAEVVLAKAFVDYNEDRIHSALGYITPSEFVCKLEGGNK